MAFMTDAVDLAVPPGDAVVATLRAYLEFVKALPQSFRFDIWRRLDALQDERAAHSEQMTRPVAFRDSVPLPSPQEAPMPISRSAAADDPLEGGVIQ